MSLIPIRLRGYTPTAHTSDGGQDPNADFLTKHQTWFIVILAGILGTVSIVCIYALWRGPQRVFFPCCSRCRRRRSSHTPAPTEDLEGKMKGLEGGDRGGKPRYLTDLKRQMESHNYARAANGSKEGLVRARSGSEAGTGAESKRNKLRKARHHPIASSKSTKKGNVRIAFAPTHIEKKQSASSGGGAGGAGHRETVSSFGHPASMFTSPTTAAPGGYFTRGGDGNGNRRLSMVPELEPAHEDRPEFFYGYNPDLRERIDDHSFVPMTIPIPTPTISPVLATHNHTSHASPSPILNGNNSVTPGTSSAQPNPHCVAYSSTSTIPKPRKTWGPSPLGGGPPPALGYKNGYGYTGSPLSNHFPHGQTQSLVITNLSPTSGYPPPQPAIQIQMPQPVRSPRSPTSDTGWAM